jgi:hypothetical protein
MSTTANVVLALALLLGSGPSALAATTHHGKAGHRIRADEPRRPAPPIAHSPIPGCVTDEGGGRIRPCGGDGGTGSGGGM